MKGVFHGDGAGRGGAGGGTVGGLERLEEGGEMGEGEEFGLEGCERGGEGGELVDVRIRFEVGVVG